MNDVVTLDKKYRTVGGNDVELHEIRLQNSAGGFVTFPVKGSILHVKPSGRIVREYAIWKLDGHSMPTGTTPDDLIEINT